jgi:hypothetical protein
MSGGRAWCAAGSLAAVLAGAHGANAASALRMEYPDSFGTVPASTYDEDRRRVGDAHLVVERLEGGNVRLFSESGIAGGARTVAFAELAPVGDGRALGILTVDHRAGVASCTRSNGEGDVVKQIELGDGDRVANVPLNLFFLPLVRGETNRLTFQVFLCGSGPRLVDFQASLAPRKGRSRGVVEVRYGPDFGNVVSMIARNFVPKLSFWFDTAKANRWVGHRLPLYGDGPEVYVIRDGVPPQWLGEK